MSEKAREDSGAVSAERKQQSDAHARENHREGVVGAVGETISDTLSAARAALDRAGEVIQQRAGEALQQRGRARLRRLRQLAKAPLPLLYEVHPEARRALPRPLGLRTIPLAEIAGTAVEPTQRVGDFRPLPQLRGANWLGRWQRLRRAQGKLAILPPIDVVRFADRYWVVDGHNRVAIGLYDDQVEIDANVTDLHLPGQPAMPAGELAPVLTDLLEIRAAGQGRRGPITADAHPDDAT